MKRFLLISIGVSVLLNCASYPKKNNFQKTEVTSTVNNLYFSNPNKDYIYKAHIEVYKNTFGGIFIVKKIGEKNHRIVFTTEMGNKIFDFSFNKDDFKVNYILDDLNKKILINILKKDFKILITKNPITLETYTFNNETIKKTTLDKKEYYYFENPKIDKIHKIVRANNGKENVRFLFTEISNTIAQQIEIIHSNIELKITLKSIN